MARRQRALVPQLWKRKLGVRRTWIDAAADRQHQRSSDQGERAQISLAAGPPPRRSSVIERSRPLRRAAGMAYDLILRQGRVIDPSQKLDEVVDIGFSAGKVSRIGPGLKADAGTTVRDVSGYIITPGLIDLHTHVYWGGTSLGVDAEEFCRKSGVTTAVDTGSAGPGNFAGFRKHVIEPSAVRILAYLHVSFAGIFAYSRRVMVGESEEIRLLAPLDAVEVANANRDVIVGIKVRVGAI